MKYFRAIIILLTSAGISLVTFAILFHNTVLGILGTIVCMTLIIICVNFHEEMEREIPNNGTVPPSEDGDDNT
jgi:preprotein translocase subunit SecY